MKKEGISMYETYRIGAKEKSQKRLKPTIKKVSNLEEKVRDYIIFLRDCDAETFKKETGRKWTEITRKLTKEEIAKKFQVKPHEIEQIFVLLNKEGVLSQPNREFAHDTNRNPMFGGWESGWAANSYDIVRSLDKWLGAVRENNFKKIDHMLENEIKTDKDKVLYEGLYESVSHFRGPQLNMMKYLLEKGANPIYNNSLELLEYALGKKDEKIITLLLNHISDLSIENEHGENLFSIACAKYPHHVLTLFEYGFSIDAKNKNNQSPLVIAAIHNQVETFKFLISKGADLKAKDNNKKTAFLYAVGNENKEILKEFIPFRNELRRDEKKMFKKIRVRLLF